MPSSITEALVYVGVVLALLITVALVFLLVATLARTAGYGWARGVAQGERAVRREATERRLTKLPAPATGGVCVVGHFVEPGTLRCRLGHAFNAKRTLATDREALEAAHLEHRAKVDDFEARAYGA